jgi:hypothetical protein
VISVTKTRSVERCENSFVPVQAYLSTTLG